MISSLVIQNQLKTYLPKLTSLFSTTLTSTAIIAAGSPQVLRITSAAHGLSNGNYVTITNGLLNSSITAVTSYIEPISGDTIISFTTATPHDLTMNYDLNQVNDKILLAGFTSPAINNYWTLYNIPDENTFEIIYNVLPTLNGHEVLTEIRELGINGTWKISNVTLNTFDILLVDTPVLSTIIVPQLTVTTGFSISSAADYQKASAIYTKQSLNNYWMFVIMESARASKDKEIISDAYSANTVGTEQRVRVINRFSINVFIPTKTELAGVQAMDFCWTDMLTNILTVLQGVPFGTYDNTTFLTSFIEHGQVDYTGAYYVHAYEFEYVYDINIEQSFIKAFPETVGFRRFYTSFNEANNGSYNDL